MSVPGVGHLGLGNGLVCLAMCLSVQPVQLPGKEEPEVVQFASSPQQPPPRCIDALKSAIAHERLRTVAAATWTV